MVPAPKGENPPAKYYKLGNKDQPSRRQSTSFSEAARLIKTVKHSARNKAQHLEMLVLHIGKGARHRVFSIMVMFNQRFDGATNRLTEIHHSQNRFVTHAIQVLAGRGWRRGKNLRVRRHRTKDLLLYPICNTGKDAGDGPQD